MSWSTIVLMVFFSSRISPLHVDGDLLRQVAVGDGGGDLGDVAHLARSGCRPWSSRCRSGPSRCRPRPCTSAWPPSLPSVPTSRATRVTSEANELSWSTIVLMVFFSSRISPLTSTVIFLRQVAVGDGGGHLGDVAHLAGQVAGHGVDVVGQVLPRAGDALAPRPGRRACLRCRPRGRRASPRRRSELSWSTIVLMVFFSSRISPCTSTVIFLDRSPLATAVVTSAMLRTWPVRLPAMRVDVVGEVLPGAGDALAPRPGRRACLRCRPRGPRGSPRRRTTLS